MSTSQQCIDMDNQLKSKYGNDYRTNRTTFPLTSASLVALSSVAECKSYFGYDGLVNEFCSDIKNFESSVGGNKSCKDFDTDGSKAKEYCLSKVNDTDPEPRMRNRSDLCSYTYLKGKYVETAEGFCRQYPKNSWCKCYNIVNKVCDVSTWNMENAAGCKDLIGNLDINKKYFKDGYNTLRTNAKCRPRTCDDSSRTYIPTGTLTSCQPTYHFCDNDIDIRALSNSDIVIKCNRGMKESELPDWFQDTIDKYEGDVRAPPFDTFPLSMLPITEWPSRFTWYDRNVRYLTYSGTSSASLISCCCCIMLLMLISNLKKK